MSPGNSIIELMNKIKLSYETAGRKKQYLIYQKNL
jgi:hypothetical protein